MRESEEWEELVWERSYLNEKVGVRKLMNSNARPRGGALGIREEGVVADNVLREGGWWKVM